MTSIWEEIRNAFYDIFRKKDLIRAVEQRELRPYNVLQIDLGTERKEAEFRFKGDTLSVIHIDGTASIKFNEKDNDEYDLTRIQEIKIPFYRFFLTNEAQSGKKLIISVGREAAVTIVPSPTSQTVDPRVSIDAWQTVDAGATATVNPTATCPEYFYVDRVLARFVQDTGNSSSYIRWGYNYANSFHEMGKVTGTQPSISFDPKHLEVPTYLRQNDGIILEYYNAGTASKIVGYRVIGRRVM